MWRPLRSAAAVSVLSHRRFASLNTGRSRVEGAGIPDFGGVQLETGAITARAPFVGTS